MMICCKDRGEKRRESNSITTINNNINTSSTKKVVCVFYNKDINIGNKFMKN